VRGSRLPLVDIFLYLLNAALKLRLVGYSLFIISITYSYVVPEGNSQQQTPILDMGVAPTTSVSWPVVDERNTFPPKLLNFL